MSEDLKQTRRKLLEVLIAFRESYLLPFDERVEALKEVLAALAALNVVIEAEDQTLPEVPWMPLVGPIPLATGTQKYMLKAGFKKVYPLTDSPSEPADPDAGLKLRPEIKQRLREIAKQPRNAFVTREQIEPAQNTDAPEIIEDGFGTAVPAICPQCGNRTMYVCRPGDIRCSVCYDGMGAGPCIPA